MGRGLGVRKGELGITLLLFHLRLGVLDEDVRLDEVVAQEALEGVQHGGLHHHAEGLVVLVGRVPEVHLVLLQAHEGLQLLGILQLHGEDFVALIGLLGGQGDRHAGEEHPQGTHFELICRPTTQLPFMPEAYQLATGL